MSNSSFYKKIIFFLFALVPFLAFYIFDYTFFPYITGRGFAFRLIIEISAILYLILALYDKEYLPRKSKLLAAYFIFIILLFISNILGANTYLSFFSGYERLEGFWTHLHLFLYFFILISTFKDEMDWKKMFAWFMIGSIPILIFGYAQLFSQKDFSLSKKIADKTWTTISVQGTTTTLYGKDFTSVLNTAYPTGQGNGLRIDSRLGNAAYSAIYFLWAFFFFVLFAYKSDEKWKSLSGWQEFLALTISAIIIILKDLVNTFATIDTRAGLQLIPDWLVGIYPALVWISYFVFIYYAISFVKKIVANRISPIWLTIWSILTFILLIYTQTRGAYIGILVGIFVGIIILFIKRKSLTQKIHRKIISSLFVLMLIGVISLVSVIAVSKNSSFVKDNIFLSRISTINLDIANPFLIYHSVKTENYKEMLTTFGDGTLVSRGLNISIALNGLTESVKTFIFGWGQENYSIVFSKYFDPRMYAQEAWFDRTHNVFMDWFIAGGILGLVSYLSLYVISIYLLWKKNNNIVENTILTSAIIGYFIHNVFVFDNLISYIYFFFILAYIVYLCKDKEQLFSDSFINSINKKITIFVFVLISLIAFLLLIYRPLSASSDAIFANQYLQNYTSDNGDKDINNVIKYYKSAISYNSLGTTEVLTNAIQNYSNVLNISDDLKKQKTNWADDVKIYYNFINENIPLLEKYNNKNQATNILIASFYNNSDYDKAKLYMDKALALGGDKKQLTLTQYAQISIQHNDIDKALGFAQKAYNLETTDEKTKTFLDNVTQYAKQKAENTKTK